MYRNHIAYIDPDNLSREFFAQKIDGQYNTDTIGFSNEVDAVRHIRSDNSISFIVMKVPSGRTVFETLYLPLENLGRDFSILLILDTQKSDLKLPKVNHIDFSLALKGDLSEVESVFLHHGILKSHVYDDDFEKIAITDLLRFDQLCFNIYLRLSSSKYIKIVNPNAVEGRETLIKYQTKGIKHIFVKKDEYGNYLELLQENVRDLYEYDFISDSLKIDAQLTAIDYMYKNLKYLGISSAATEITNMTISSVLCNLRKSSKLWSLLITKLNSSCYLVQHSLALSYLTCTVATELGWNTKSTLEKLVMASFLHDIGLDNENLSIINATDTDDFYLLKEEEVNEVLNHPTIAVEKLREVTNLPPNVETIILEHHERPNGRGFPFKKRAARISPMSCVFILSEVFWNQITRREESQKSKRDILKCMKYEFEEGNFRKPLDAFISLFA